MCFIKKPIERATFSDIVELLEKELTSEERLEYRRQSEQYDSMRSLISDPNTQFKRVRPSSEKGDSSDDGKQELDRNSYVKMTARSNAFPESGSQCQSVLKPNNSSTNQKIVESDNQQVETCDNLSNGITYSKLLNHDNIDSNKSNSTNGSLTQPNMHDDQGNNPGYITIQAANESQISPV